MMIRHLCILFAVLGTAVSAQSLPERYSVTDVANDDVLNIRAAPTASSDIVGKFGPYSQYVEVLRTQDSWGYVGMGEGSGWVSMRYLTPNPPIAGELPRPMVCSGTEPFWTLSFGPNDIEYVALGEGPRPLSTNSESVASNGYLIDMRESETVNRTVIIDALPCNDGMSDRDFGMSVRMFTQSTKGNSVQTGCCTMQVN